MPKSYKLIILDLIKDGKISSYIIGFQNCNYFDAEPIINKRKQFFKTNDLEMIQKYFVKIMLIIVGFSTNLGATSVRYNPIFIGPLHSYNQNYFDIPLLINDNLILANKFQIGGFSYGLNYEYLLGDKRKSYHSLQVSIYNQGIESKSTNISSIKVENNIDLSYLGLDFNYRLLVAGSPFEIFAGPTMRLLISNDSYATLSSLDGEELPSSMLYDDYENNLARVYLDTERWNIFWNIGVGYNFYFPGFVVKPQISYNASLYGESIMKPADFIDFRLAVILAF